MNRKIKIKTVAPAVLVLCVCAGCSAGQDAKYTREELDNLAEIRIYS